jgi:hypothetical protein
VALLALLVAADEDTDAFEEALEELSETVLHHLDEEERDVLNAARENVDLEVRAELGRAFIRRRAELLEDHPGAEVNVRMLVEKARQEGLLDD